MLTLFFIDRYLGNKDGNSNLITSTNSNNEDSNNYFAFIKAQVVRHKNSMAKILTSDELNGLICQLY